MKDGKASTASLLKLSVSSTKTFEQCAQKYYWSYIDKSFPRKSWDHLELGTFAHSCLEQFHKEWIADKNLDLRNLMGKCFGEQRQKNSKLSIEQLEDAKNMLQDYLFGVETSGMPNTLYTELPFELVIGEDFFLRGFIDRLDMLPSGDFSIIDYKTTKNEKYLDDFQLLVYGLVLSKKYPHVKSFKGSYILLRHASRFITYDFDLADLKKCEEKLIDFGQRIKNEKLWPKNPSPLCKWCDFYEPCQGEENNWIGE